MVKYYIIYFEKGKLPSLLLNSEEEKEEGKKDRVVFWTKKKTALKEIKELKSWSKKARYSVVKEVV